MSFPAGPDLPPAVTMDQPATSPPPPPYTLHLPAGEPVPLVLSSPHSGRVLPRHVLDRLRADPRSLMVFDDGPIDKLVLPACAAGAVLIAARYPRVVVDLNREPDELDPDLVLDPGGLPEMRVSARARAGLGVVPSRVGSQPVWRGRLDAGELRRRLDTVFHPYHAELERLARDLRGRFGASLVLDCHSMPGGPGGAGGEPAAAGVDATLGDRFGRSCEPGLVDVAEAALAAAGLRVSRNRPYAGGYITGRHGRPDDGAGALQLELRRGLFMDEATHVPHAGFAALQDVLANLAATLAAATAHLGRPRLGEAPLARAS